MGCPAPRCHGRRQGRRFEARFRPGLGQAAVTAGTGGDAALLVGIALVSAVIVFGGNLIASILYQVVDPRIKRGGGAV